ncbi:MAG: hypothetical protein MUE97_04040 [Phycisphaerales bacterium]|jgi:hypothetical protein|nr:hypothetical protein [Phycisphaerales bacterium]
MAKDLLEGIVDKSSGDLLNKKGEHVKVLKDGKLVDPKKATGGAASADPNRPVKLAVALLLIGLAVGLLWWRLGSMQGPGPVDFDPTKDVAGPDPTKPSGRNERVETIQPGNMRIAPQ